MRVGEAGGMTGLTQAADGTSPPVRLSLLSGDGQLLIQSDGQSPTHPNDQITQHLLPGTYFLQVEGLGGGTGAYTLTTDFLPAVPPFRPLPLGPVSLGPLPAGDLTRDGIADLTTPATAP